MSSLQNSYSQLTVPRNTAISAFQTAIERGVAGIVGNPDFEIVLNTRFRFGFFISDRDALIHILEIISDSVDFTISIFENADYIIGSNPLPIARINQTKQDYSFLTVVDNNPAVVDQGTRIFGPKRLNSTAGLFGQNVNSFGQDIILRNDIQYLLEFEDVSGITANFNINMYFAELTTV